jgi:hypothetical protein
MVSRGPTVLKKGVPEVAEATLKRRTRRNQKLHFSPFKNPFNLFAPKMVHVSY